MLRAVRTALLPPPPAPPTRRERLRSAASELLQRLPSPAALASRATAWSSRARALLATF
jgi:hypothetical protein